MAHSENPRRRPRPGDSVQILINWSTNAPTWCSGYQFVSAEANGRVRVRACIGAMAGVIDTHLEIHVRIDRSGTLAPGDNDLGKVRHWPPVFDG